MSGRFTSAPWLALQALSLAFLALAAAVNLREATAALDGSAWWIAAASVVALELGVVTGATALAYAWRKSRAASAVAATLLALCVGNALWNGATFVHSKNAAQSAARAAGTAAREAQSKRVDALQLQRSKYDALRSTDTVRADMTRCESRAACAKLQKQLDDALLRDGLVTTLTAERSALALLQPAAQHAAPAALMLHDLTGADPARSELYASLLYILLLQLASPLTSLLAAMLFGAAPVRLSGATTVQQAQHNVVPFLPRATRMPAWMLQLKPWGTAALTAAVATPLLQFVPPFVAPAAAAHVQHVQRSAASTRAALLLQHLADAGGELHGTTRALAKQLQMHPRTFGHAYAELQRSAALRVKKHSGGGLTLQLSA